MSTSQSTASSNNNSVLASLPPIVPSIGFSKGKRSAASTANGTANSNDPTTLLALAESQSQSNANNNPSNSGPATTPSNSNTNIPPSIKLGNRLILTTSHTPRPWAWKSFTSSARQNDDDKTQFYHWVRANIEYADYPYARFDVSLDPLVYTEEEYGMYLEMVDVEELNKDLEEEYDLITGEKKRKKEKKEQQTTTADGKQVVEGTKSKSIGDGKNSNNDTPSSSKTTTTTASTTLQNQLAQQNKILPWTKAETDTLMELARSCDLRWPVIIDRWHSRFATATNDDDKKSSSSPISCMRKLEDLQHRYYQVGSILAQRRVEEVMAREVAKLGGGGGPVVGGDTSTSGGATATAASAAVGAAGIAPGPAAVGAAAPAANTTVKVENADAPTTGAAVTATNDFKPTPTPSSSTSTQQQQQPSTALLPPDQVQALQTAHQLTTLHPSLAPPLSLPATGTATHHHRGAKLFDLAAERARRAQLDRIWHRSKEEEREEDELRSELRNVEAQLRRLKKSGKHLVPAGSGLAAPPAPSSGMTGGGVGGTIGSSQGNVHAAAKRGPAQHKPPPNSLPPPQPTHRIPLDPFLHTHTSVSASFADTAPVPTPGTPYLQSGRLFPPSVEGHSGLNKNTLKQMGAILDELHVPKEPIATKRSCDLFDGVRKDALTLLILQKMVLRKEAELTAKRSKLASLQGEAADAAAAKSEEKKEDGGGMDGNKAEGKGAKGKKAGKGKAKRPRADSGASAASAEGGKKGGGDGPKKKPRKKSAATSSAAAAAASVAPANASVVPSIAATGPPGAATGGTIPSSAPHIPSASPHNNSTTTT
ncbi:hypothetical protein ACHAXR_004209, partial [Thalassiosira sp. AJA248-18]